jgi:hypothetical protein
MIALLLTATVRPEIPRAPESASKSFAGPELIPEWEKRTENCTTFPSQEPPISHER